MSPEEKFDKSVVDVVKAQEKMNEALITYIEELEARIEKLEAKQPTASDLTSPYTNGVRRTRKEMQ
jgi:BMFP domain-containing protein YqiC